ncbi:hypothetical protein ABPG73_016964 [Tetrahymena malaccensis]
MASNNKIQDLDEILKQKDFMKQVLQKDASLVRLSNSLPQNDEMKFYMNNEQLKQKQKAINIKILQQLKKIASFISFEHASSIDLNHFSHIIDMNDLLFENIDTSLDKIKKINNVTESSLFDPSKTVSSEKGFKSISGEQSEDIITIATKEKPQNNFKDCIDNSIQHPFIPVIKEKLNADVPLDDVIVQVQKEGAESFFKTIQDPLQYEFPHPYAYEIENFSFSEQQLQTENIVVQEPISLKEELVFVDKEDILDEMIESLKQCSEIAIDLEHHSYRSFNGITCLMQISSRNKDYIVDVFSVWRSLHKLNVVTTDKNIVKVLHGADMDIQWLQRDFGIYIVNLFDTGQAARILSMPSYALAYLLQSISKVPTDKKYQLADWRIRPLPREMISYARSDTHYLLSIYDNLRIQLVNKAVQQGQNASHFIESVLNKSRAICLKKYVKPILDDEKYHSILQNQRIILSDRKFRILKRLLEWRYQMAAKYDENPTFVLANDILFNIVNRLPQTHKEFASSNLKLSYVCQYHANEILTIIKEEIESEQKSKSGEQESTTKNQSEMETEDLIYASRNLNNTSVYQIFNTQSHRMEEELEEEVSFQFEIIDVQIGVYQGNLNILEDHIQQSSTFANTEIQTKIEKINSSFFYADPVDFYCEKYPFMREAYELAKLQEEEIMKKRNDLAYIQSKNPFEGENEEQTNNQEEERDIYLAFDKEKGPSSKPKEVEQIDVPDLPQSYEDQFKTSLKKRKYNFGNDSKRNAEQDEEEEEENENGEKMYKKRSTGQKSTFDMLIEQGLREQTESEDSDSDEGEKQKKKKKREVTEEEKKQIEDNFNQYADKIRNRINKDPKFKSGINTQKSYNSNNNKKGGNKKTNKFISKFNKSGF